MKCSRLLPLVLSFCFGACQCALQAGELAGKCTPTGRISAVKAIDRDAKKIFAGTFDPKTGSFLFTNLPTGTYDVFLQTELGRIEGVNLRMRTREQSKPTTLLPGAVDRGDLEDLLRTLKQAPVEKARPTRIAGVKLIMSNRKVTNAYLVPQDGHKAPVSLKLTDEELAYVAGVLTGTVVFFKARDELPTHADVFIELAGNEVRRLLISQSESGLSEADRKWIIDWVANVKMFENKKRVLFMRGDDSSAKVLVEKIRDEKTTLRVPEPTVFWRVEVWDFRKLHGGWEKTDYAVQQRHKMSVREFRKLNWVFEPALGGFVVSAQGRTTVPDYRVPDRFNHDHGRTPY